MNVALNRIATAVVIGLLVFAGVAQAGHLSRPDLVQADDTFTDTNQPSGAFGSAYQYVSESYVTGSIAMTVTNGTTSAGFSGEIQDFDKASKTMRIADMRNQKWTYVSAWTYESPGSNSSVGQSSMERCKLRISSRDSDGDQTPDDARWMMGCNNSILDDLGMSQNAQDRFIAVFKEVKPKGVTAKTLTYTGKGPRD